MDNRTKKCTMRNLRMRNVLVSRASKIWDLEGRCMVAHGLRNWEKTACRNWKAKLKDVDRPRSYMAAYRNISSRARIRDSDGEDE